MSFDQSLFEAIHSVVGTFQILDVAAIFFAEYFPYLLVIVFVFFLFLERNWKVRFYAFALAALSTILARGIVAEVIRFFYFRPRPPAVFSIEPLIHLPSSASFPSGHAVFFFALATSVFFMNRRWGIWFFIAAFVMGVARVFVGVHWPLDILGGAALGIASAVAVQYILKRSHREPASAS